MGTRVVVAVREAAATPSMFLPVGGEYVECRLRQIVQAEPVAEKAPMGFGSGTKSAPTNQKPSMGFGSGKGVR